MTAMDITIHSSFLPHDDPDTALAFYRDTLGFEVRLDVGDEGLRWITVGPVGLPDTSLVPPAGGRSQHHRRAPDHHRELANGTYASLLLATPDLDGTFDKLQAAGTEIVQEPTEQPYGIRDSAVREPAGNMLRIQQRD